MELFRYDVNKYSPTQMVVIPLILLIISLAIVGMTMISTGLPVKPGMDFSGGTAVTIITPDSRETLAAVFTGYPLTDIGEGISGGKFLTFGVMGDAQFQSLTALINSRYPDAQVNQIGESFGKSLQEQAILALIISFIGMSIVVAIAFRTFIPSCAVVLSAFADMVMTAAAMNIIGISLSLGTTAALLMLIGYSVDSDILLTMRVLKRQGKLEEKLSGAFRTGIIMTSTAIAAAASMFVVTYISQVQIIMQMSAVILIGLLFDILNTWLTNAGIIKWYVAEREGR
jgi:preprotein translocase subunit SecF